MFLFHLLLSNLFIYINSETLFVFEHCRHGARGMKELKNDTDIFKQKWIGSEELSAVGLRQHYLLGSLMRNQYSHLLDWNNYNTKDIFVYSTPTNRTIMSARAHLFGMFNNNNTKQLNKNQNEKSIPNYLRNKSKILNFINKTLNNSYILPNKIPSEIPIHIIERKEKLFQFEKDDNCIGIEKQRDKNKKKKSVKNAVESFNNKYGEKLVKYLGEKKEDYFKDLKNVQAIALAFIINKIDGRDLSEFQNETGFDLEKFYNDSMEILVQKSLEIQSGDDEKLIAFASSSVLLRFILSFIDKVVENDKKQKKIHDVPKFFLLSAHDTTIVMSSDLLNILFKSEKYFPSFATSQVYELNKENNEYYINFIFNGEKLKTVKYEYFKKTIENEAWTLEETGYFCGFYKKIFNGWKTLTIIFSILLLLAFILFIIMCLKRKKELMTDF
jgi:hypothetical protein